MTENLDFTEIAKDSVTNEPERTIENAEYEPENNSKPLNNDSENGFEANAFDLVPSIIEGFSAFWRVMWGKSDGAELSEDEKNGLISLFQRGCEHFGLVKYIAGTKGFIVAVIVKVFGITIPRVTKKETREHFTNEFLNKEDKAEDAQQPISPTAGNSQPPEGYTFAE